MSTLYYDVTSIVDARHGKMTGIQRVEYEVGKRLVAKGAKSVAWDPWGQTFIDVDFERAVERIAHAQSMDIDDTLDEPADSAGFRPSRLLVGLLSRLAAIVPKNWSRHDWIVLRALWTLAAEHPFMSPPDRRAAARRIGILSERRRTYEYLDALVSRRLGIWPSSGTGGPVAFASGDSLVSLSIWWLEGPFDAIERMDPGRRVRLVSLIYDLIPIRRPEFVSLEAPRVLFGRFIHRLLRRGDRLAAISRFVADDVEAYARETGVEIAPVVPVPLCSDMAERIAPTFTSRLDREALKPGCFVPLVSTINPRKNYHWAYELWRRAYEEVGEALPALVFVGQRGWDDDDLFMRLERDTAMWGRKILHVDAPTDGEVAWLYRNCAYTIFPSRYEGWGLPVSESLSFGKYCLVADNTSLREAGAGLAFHADTLDGLAWLAEVRRLALEDGYLGRMNSAVQAGHRRRDWDDVAREIEALAAAP